MQGLLRKKPSEKLPVRKSEGNALSNRVQNNIPSFISKASAESTAILATIPKDLMSQLFSFLNWLDRLVASRVIKRWKTIIGSPSSLNWPPSFFPRYSSLASFIRENRFFEHFSQFFYPTTPKTKGQTFDILFCGDNPDTIETKLLQPMRNAIDSEQLQTVVANARFNVASEVYSLPVETNTPAAASFQFKLELNRHHREGTLLHAVVVFADSQSRLETYLTALHQHESRCKVFVATESTLTIDKDKFPNLVTVLNFQDRSPVALTRSIINYFVAFSKQPAILLPFARSAMMARTSSAFLLLELWGGEFFWTFCLV